jgi:DNA-binding transcriptional ArsR family regulator
MNSTAAVAALNALAHEYRLAAFRLLVQAGPEGLTAGTIAAQVGISPASMSFHIKDLVRADLIQPRHAGRQIFYSARFEAMSDLIAYLTENCCGGNPCPPTRIAACGMGDAPP